MKADDVKFTLFSFGMGGAIASSLTSIYILAVSLMGGTSIVHENNSIIAVIEVALLTFAIATCIMATEIYLKYLKANGSGTENPQSTQLP